MWIKKLVHHTSFILVFYSFLHNSHLIIKKTKNIWTQRAKIILYILFPRLFFPEREFLRQPACDPGILWMLALTTALIDRNRPSTLKHQWEGHHDKKAKNFSVFLLTKCELYRILQSVQATSGLVCAQSINLSKLCKE